MQKHANKGIYDEYQDRKKTSSVKAFLSGIASILDIGGTNSSLDEYVRMIKNRPSDISRYFPDANKYWNPDNKKPVQEKEG